MVVYPEWALSPEGVARGWQCSRGVDYHVSNPAGMSHLFYYTEQHPPPPSSPPRTQNPRQVETYKTHLGSVISEQQVYRADHVGIYYIYLIYPSWTTYHLNWVEILLFPLIETLAQVVPNNKIIPLLTAAFCWSLEILSPRAGILKAWRPQQYRESWNGTLTTGANTSSPWQRVLIRRMVTAVKEPIETQVANSFDTWLSSNGMRVFLREV